MSDLGFAELISKIGHELRSPLTAVQGFSGTLVKRWERFSDEQRLQLVTTIHADAERMGRIISEVLDLARMETGRLDLHRSEVDLAAVTARAAEHVSHLEGAERVAVAIEDELMVWADAGRLEHIVTNLVENGIKFSELGPVEVAAREAGDMVEISVSDRGIGIEPERIEHVFSAPAPAGQMSGPIGTGLGLYLTKRLVDAHDGTISVSSVVGEGSVFKVRLPRTQPRT